LSIAVEIAVEAAESLKKNLGKVNKMEVVLLVVCLVSLGFSIYSYAKVRDVTRFLEGKVFIDERTKEIWFKVSRETRDALIFYENTRIDKNAHPDYADFIEGSGQFQPKQQGQGQRQSQPQNKK